MSFFHVAFVGDTGLSPVSLPDWVFFFFHLEPEWICTNLAHLLVCLFFPSSLCYQINCSSYVMSLTGYVHLYVSRPWVRIHLSYLWELTKGGNCMVSSPCSSLNPQGVHQTWGLTRYCDDHVVFWHGNDFISFVPTIPVS